MSTQVILQGQDTENQADLYISFELSDKKWQLTMNNGHRGPSRYSVDAGDTAAVTQGIPHTQLRVVAQD